MKNRILITGANGFIGSKLCQLFDNEKIKYLSFIRDEEKITSYSLHVEIDEKNDFSPYLSNINIIIHCANIAHNNGVSEEELHKKNTLATLNLAKQAAELGVKRFIYLSSVKANGEITKPHAPFTENDNSKQSDTYGKSKYNTEKALLELANNSKLEVVIIRPPLVYGEGVKANFLSLINLSKTWFPLPFGAIHNQRSFIYVKNLTDFIRLCLNHPKAANQIFLVSDDQDISTTELLRKCAKIQHNKIRLLPIPPRLLKNIGRLIGKEIMMNKMCDSLQIDISKAKKQLGWTPPYTLEEGLQATIAPLQQKEKK